MPRKIYVVPSAGVGALLYVSDFTLAEHLGAPVPCICKVRHQGRGLGAVVDACGVLARQRRLFHLDAAAVGPVVESGGLAGAAELVLHAQVFGLLFEKLKLGKLGPILWIWLRFEDFFGLFIIWITGSVCR